MGKPETASIRERAVEEPTRIEQEPESLMSVEEFGATNHVNRTLLAGFISYCRRNKIPPRLNAAQWKTALTNWRQMPVTT